MAVSKRTWLFLGGFLLLAVAPLFGSHYLHFLLATIMIYALVALGLTVLMGFGGQVSIGHAGFWAIGAYMSGILITKLGVSFVAAVLAGALLSASFGALLAIPALRVQGHYLAIATLGFALVIQQVLLQWEGVTGGRAGLLVPRPSLVGQELSEDFSYYYFLLAVVAVGCWMVENLRRSRTGKALLAMKMSPIAAQCAGLNRARLLITAFTLSAFLTGLSGALYGSLIGYLSTETFSLNTSLAFLTMTVIGGLGSVPGAVLGAIYLTLAPELLRELKSAQMAVYGITLVLCIRFLPGGLSSLPEKARAWSAKFGRRSA
jgi:branched-chain amino acid transport system permease protein